MEFSGVVAAVPSAPPGGNREYKYKVGDKVFGAAQGAYAEMVAAPEEGLRGMPEGWSFEDAAGLMVTAPTSYAALVFRAKVQKGMLNYGRPPPLLIPQCYLLNPPTPHG